MFENNLKTLEKPVCNSVVINMCNLVWPKHLQLMNSKTDTRTHPAADSSAEYKVVTSQPPPSQSIMSNCY